MTIFNGVVGGDSQNSRIIVVRGQWEWIVDGALKIDHNRSTCGLYPVERFTKIDYVGVRALSFITAQRRSRFDDAYSQPPCLVGPRRSLPPATAFYNSARLIILPIDGKTMIICGISICRMSCILDWFHVNHRNYCILIFCSFADWIFRHLWEKFKMTLRHIHILVTLFGFLVGYYDWSVVHYVHVCTYICVFQMTLKRNYLRIKVSI